MLNKANYEGVLYSKRVSINVNSNSKGYFVRLQTCKGIAACFGGDFRERKTASTNLTAAAVLCAKSCKMAFVFSGPRRFRIATILQPLAVAVDAGASRLRGRCTSERIGTYLLWVAVEPRPTQVLYAYFDASLVKVNKL